MTTVEIPNPNNESAAEIDSSHEVRKDQLEPTPENFEAQQKRARKQLQDCFDTLLRSAMGGTYAHPGEEGFSGYAASLYVLTSLKNERGKETPELVKIGWGEFSRETFEGDRYSIFRSLPFKVYCVSQNDSYFADAQLRKDMIENPAKYLQEHSLFVASNGRVKFSKKIGSKRHLDEDVEAIPYDEMLRTVRNQIIKERSTPEEFAAFLKELPDDPIELGRYMSDLEHRVDWMGDRDLQTADEKTKANVRRKWLMYLFLGMGVETVGIAVGDKKAMESVLALKKRFDFEKKLFT